MDQTCNEGSQVVLMEPGAGEVDFPATTGNKGTITLEHMMKMKFSVIVGRIGHFDNEIVMEKLVKVEEFMSTSSRRSTASCSPSGTVSSSSPPAVC